jgi:hypothetical protein
MQSLSFSQIFLEFFPSFYNAEVYIEPRFRWVWASFYFICLRGCLKDCFYTFIECQLTKYFKAVEITIAKKWWLFFNDFLYCMSFSWAVVKLLFFGLDEFITEPSFITIPSLSQTLTFRPWGVFSWAKFCNFFCGAKFCNYAQVYTNGGLIKYRNLRYVKLKHKKDWRHDRNGLMSNIWFYCNEVMWYNGVDSVLLTSATAKYCRGSENKNIGKIGENIGKYRKMS